MFLNRFTSLFPSISLGMSMYLFSWIEWIKHLIPMKLLSTVFGPVSLDEEHRWALEDVSSPSLVSK